jgi:ADP-ribosylglycohydrolase
MIGALLGDIIGSVFEGKNVKTTEINLYNFGSRITDDSVLTIAIADALLSHKDYQKHLLIWANNYPQAGYGARFKNWMHSEEPKPYNSWGNGSAMRVSPIAYAFDTLQEVLEEAKRSALPTHNHPEGIKGSQAIASAVFLARIGKTKSQIRDYIQKEFEYDLNRTIKDIRPNYSFDLSCQGSVPEAIIAFIDSTDYESTIRLAISLGGDSDTIACMAGGIAEAYYGNISDDLLDYADKKLPNNLKQVIYNFQNKYPLKVKLE